MRIFLGIIIGYAFGVGLGLLLVYGLSSNTHDKSQEAAVTALLLVGPVAAIIGGIVAWFSRS